MWVSLIITNVPFCWGISFFRHRVSHCGPGWPQTGDPQASRVLGLQVNAPMSNKILLGVLCLLCIKHIEKVHKNIIHCKTYRKTILCALVSPMM
jgi:hypothetical protein